MTAQNAATRARALAAELGLHMLQTTDGWRLLEPGQGDHLVPVTLAPRTAKELCAWLEGFRAGLERDQA